MDRFAHPAQLFSRNQAITALTLAERLTIGHGDDDTAEALDHGPWRTSQALWRSDRIYLWMAWALYLAAEPC